MRTFLFHILVSLLPFSLSSNIFVPQSFATISEAVASAQAGDIVVLSSGLYSGEENCNILVTVDLNFRGFDGADTTVIDCAQTGSRCLMFAAGVKSSISGIQFSNGMAPGTTTIDAAAASSTSRSVLKKNNNRTIPIPIPDVSFDEKTMLRHMENTDANDEEIVGYIVRNKKSGTTRVEPMSSRRAVESPSNSKNNNKIFLRGSGGAYGPTYDDAAANALIETMGLFNTSFGGCIVADQGTSLSISDCIFTGGAAYWGGCLGTFRSTATMQNVQFYGCGITTPVGTTLAGGGACFKESVVSVFNCKFVNNWLRIEGDSTSDLYGGGLCLYNCTDSIVSGSYFDGNRVSTHGTNTGTMTGGGLLFIQGSRNTASNSSFVNNQMFSEVQSNTIIYGGGFSTYYGSSMSIYLLYARNNSIWTTDTSLGFMIGGGFYFSSTGIVVSNATAVNNALLGFDNCNARWLYGAGICFEASSNIMAQNLYSQGNVVQVSGNSLSMLYGAGLYMENTVGATVTGITCYNNSMKTQGFSTGSMYGAGIYLENIHSTRYSMLDLDSNGLSTTTSSKGALLGGGIYVYSCTELYFEYASITRNHVSAIYSGITYTKPYLTVPTPDAIPQCAFNVKVVQTSGMITDGTSADSQYQNNLDCMWSLAPTAPMDRSFAIYKIQIFRLDVELSSACTWDWVSLHDGPSSSSPIIGKYCGQLDYYQCSGGPCPPIDNIVSQGGVLSIAFHTDESDGGNGFALNWTMLLSPSRSGNAGVMVDITDVASVAMGAGAAIYESSVTLNHFTVQYNLAQHPLEAVAAGILAANRATVNIWNSSLEFNVANGAISGGCAMGAVRAAKLMITNVKAVNNSAICSGMCFWAIDGTMRCPSCWGGAVMSLSATINSNFSLYAYNTVTCAPGTINCQINGGAIAMGGNSVLKMDNDVCMNNSASCEDSNACQWGAGGCLIADSGLSTVTNSELTQNKITGIGGGGAIFGLGTARMVIGPRAWIHHNYAREGGAIWMAGSANLTTISSILENNYATSVAGGVAVTQNAWITLNQTMLINNSASRASAILGYNDNNIGTYTMINVSVVGTKGSTALMLGKLQFQQVNWDCTYAGSVFSKDSTSEFFSLSCDPCGSGSYSVQAASSSRTDDQKCFPCAYGATCNGALEMNNGLVSLPGFWGSMAADGSVSFYTCPSGYCCPSNKKDCAYNYCQAGRVGVLCGACPPGYGFRFFSEGCSPDSTCNDAAWAFPLLFIGALCLSIWLIVTTGRPSSGMLSVLLFFYQASPLVKSTPWKHTSSTAISVIQSSFNMSPSSGESGGGGICLWAGMNAARKMAARLMFQGLVFFCLVSLYFIHWLLHRHKLNIPYMRQHPPKKTRYVNAIVRFMSIAYTVMVLTPLQLVQCIWLDGMHVWWWDARDICYADWQVLGFAIALVLIPLPLCMIVMLARWKSVDSLQKWQKGIRSVLSNGFQENRRWWMGVSLYRRLLLVIAFAGINDANWRGVATMALCCIYLAMHVYMKPFFNPITQWAETLSLLDLCLLAATSLPQLSSLQFGSTVPMMNEAELEYLQWFLMVLPGAIFVASSAKNAYDGYRAARFGGGGGGSELEMNPTKMASSSVILPLNNGGVEYYSCPLCAAEHGYNMDFAVREAWSFKSCQYHQLC